MTSTPIPLVLAAALASTLALRAAGAAGQGGPPRTGPCVTTGIPSPATTYIYSYTEGGVTSTITRRWLEVSATVSRQQMTNVHPKQGTTSVLTVAAQHVVDDLMVVDQFKSSGNLPGGGAFTSTTVHRPGLVDGPAFRVCQGRHWTIPQTAVLTTTTPGGTASNSISGTGDVIAVNAPMKVPAGTFETVNYREDRQTAYGPITIVTWRAIKEGVNVRWEYTMPKTSAVEVLVSAK